MDSIFEDLKADPLLTTRVMSLLDVIPDHLQDAVMFNRLKDVLGYLSNVEDKEWFITRLTTGKNVDKLNHVWGYIELAKSKDAIRSQLEKVGNEKSILLRFANEKNITDPEQIDGYKNVVTQETEVMNRLNSISEQMSFYER